MIQIRSNLYLGDWEDSRDKKKLTHNHINTMLNAAYEIPNPSYNPRLIKQVKIGLIDDGIKQDYLLTISKELLIQLLEDKENKVLVYCAMGQSRSACVIALALSKKENKTIKEVYEELIELKPNIRNSLMYDLTIKEEVN